MIDPSFINHFLSLAQAEGGEIFGHCRVSQSRAPTFVACSLIPTILKLFPEPEVAAAFAIKIVREHGFPEKTLLINEKHRSIEQFARYCLKEKPNLRLFDDLEKSIKEYVTQSKNEPLEEAPLLLAWPENIA